MYQICNLLCIGQIPTITPSALPLRDWPDTHCGAIYSIAVLACLLQASLDLAGLQQAGQECNRWRHKACLASPLVKMS